MFIYCITCSFCDCLVISYMVLASVYIGNYAERCIVNSFAICFQYVVKIASCTAQALGDPSVTIEQVTPPVFPSGALFPTEVYC